MKMKKQLSPATGENAGNPNTNNLPKAVRKKSYIPNKDSDFATLTESVTNKWKDMPQFTLIYTTQPLFADKSSLFKKTLLSRENIGADRSPLTKTLDNKDLEMNKGIGFVKGYLKEKYDDNATAYYALFGIQKKGKNYSLPIDRDKRIDALELIVKNIDKEGFGDKKYGNAYWAKLKEEYTELFTNANKTDGKVSSDVGIKKQLKTELKEVLNSIIHLIIANYPKTWEAELRNWGFIKESY